MNLFVLPDRNMLFYLFLKLIQIKWREREIKKNNKQTNKIYNTVGTINRKIAERHKIDSFNTHT